ncbi:potassium-transporting ATPase subunit A [Peribacillus psychrosaccharolyticus]|uniref:Potassium-transporting ATPase potassium-binding subunit n=1 Tax=Peribacillus psychrosaccharolyticus TaxID=1407 RepID=A0A974NM39_PERPY|nr:potassium-transporting ATPase subunit KdpA [Peribacillus psychrosaccharolyticus]MEC2056661.1 potassium-transporting ATPase subunit KdpA [Peribacillus psychrosaccharolyticus]MED3746115.1 potassium-transporting ATPase subunit KdpA [Peribacillus psychrosaccharolyticus]QQT00209.1 potassium-transporting ATPase subunit A [Peribacillus psychrosaccharolyticus]
MDFLQISVVLVLVLVLAIPMANYLTTVYSLETTKQDRIFGPIERIIYKLSGIQTSEMNWKKYAKALLFSNLIMFIISYLIIRFQGVLPGNPSNIANMDPILAFNTAASFLTNTNLQHYSGESGLSYLSQMTVIIFLMFTTPATGLALCIAFFRGVTGQKNIGNFYVDLVRSLTRVLLPLSILIGLILVSQGVPQTFSSTAAVTTVEGAAQNIARGPVAALESIKHLGTNGGGFFGVNSAHPFENPTGFTNILEILCMFLIPAALPLTFGRMAKNKKQGWILFCAMGSLFIVFLSVAYFSELNGNPALEKIGLSQENGSMEGKEVRFGIAQSALFTAVTTAVTTGTVNTMHDTLTPLGGLVPLAQMMLNCVFGGDGVGTVNILMYTIMAVFIAGLMVGRTPEFLGKKIEAREMKLIAIAILLHPLIILGPSAIALATEMGTSGISNSGFHGISQVVYEFTSSAANNGSGFEGLGDNTPFWNISTGLVMLFGRYFSMIAMIAVAGSLLTKKRVPETIGTLKTDNSTFLVILLATVLIIGALTFFPVLALGPVAEWLTIR